MQLIDLTGKSFGLLTVIKRTDNIGLNTGWECKCECGNIAKIRYYSLKRGDTKSCGCLRAEKLKNEKTTHGHYNSRTYHSYHSMKARCLNTNHKQYKDYGGRGIVVCKKWLNSFESFLSDMGERPKDKTLDRINNNKNYTKNNCKWSTILEQNNNKRK